MALAEADIPSRSDERLIAQLWSWLSILLFRFIKPRPTYKLEL